MNRQKKELNKNNPEKKLIKILKKHSGRNNQGKVTVRHQGGRQKRYYRMIDFKRDKHDIEATVLKIEYDPNRTVYVALVEYEDKERRYILAPERLKAGDKITAGEKVEIKTGNALPLRNIPIGVNVHNIELTPGKGGQIVRSAGSFAVLIGKDEKYAQIKLPSGEKRKILLDCYATIGQLTNIGHKFEKIGKAGRKILMGIRPTVRGTAQNPRSHPHGGGEGRSGEGMAPKTPWGKPARGKKTRKKNKWSDKLIIERRK
jgi:large subunit ribosomal protein L2